MKMRNLLQIFMRVIKNRILFKKEMSFKDRIAIISNPHSNYNIRPINLFIDSSDHYLNYYYLEDNRILLLISHTHLDLSLR